MTPEEYQAYSSTSANTTISAAMLSGPDRLLMEGWNFERDDFIVTLDSGGITRRIGYNSEWRERWNAEDLHPGKRARPDQTDQEFATLMRDKGSPLPFTRFPD